MHDFIVLDKTFTEFFLTVSIINRMTHETDTFVSSDESCNYEF